MEYRITINLDNAAFIDDERELSRILHSLAHRSMSSTPDERTIKDSNGNTVGKAEVVE